VNGAHDCGGVAGYWPVVPEADEPVFHARWEARMFALMSAVGDVGGWTLDEDRSACESMAPARYIATSYYEHWLHGLETLLQKHGLATSEEIRSGKALGPGRAVEPARAAQVWSLVTAPGSYARQPTSPARYAGGERVRTGAASSETHTRLPAYLRGRTGEVAAVHGAHVLPDSNATGGGENPQWLYTVRFKLSDIFGGRRGDIVRADLVHADLWEPYLERA
jgi:nitrile hydratase